MLAQGVGFHKFIGGYEAGTCTKIKDQYKDLLS